MAKRTFTKYPSSYVKASTEDIKDTIYDALDDLYGVDFDSTVDYLVSEFGLSKEEAEGYVWSHSDDHGQDTIFDIALHFIYKAYDDVKKIPKPDEYKVGGTYYGGTELHSVYSNELKLIDGGHCEIASVSGGVRYYEHGWAIKIGGAYDFHDVYPAVKKLKSFLEEYAEELHEDGFDVLDAEFPGYYMYGIAERRYGA